jgi:flagella synthesis protein FlgN
MHRARSFPDFVRGIQADVQDYQKLQAMLETQFALALRHDSAALEMLAYDILKKVETLNARRLDRTALLSRHMGEVSTESVRKFIQSIPHESQGKVMTLWKSLEDLVVACQEINTRNCRLLTDQYTLMQRVLKHEEHTYAPV